MNKEDPGFYALLFHYIWKSSLEEKDFKFQPNWNSLFNSQLYYNYIVIRGQKFKIFVNSDFLLRPEK